MHLALRRKALALPPQDVVYSIGLIDYVNDQCDMDPEPRPGTTPVPEPWVRWVCETFAEFTWREKQELPRGGNKTLTLF